MGETVSLSEFNVAAWAKGDYVRDYSGRDLAPVEAIMLARHAEALRGRVLEIGCGAGRVTRVLAALSDQVLAVDVSERMVEACAKAVPGARAALGDLRDLTGHADDSLGAVVAPGNVLDMLTDGDRRAALAELARLLSPGGLLLFSSHNQDHIPHMGTPLRRALSSPRELVRAVYHARHPLRRARNRRAARAFERAGHEYALVDDGVHDHRLVHYYIRRDAQERQLADAGFDLLECRDLDGGVVAPGEAAERSSELHYAARRR